MGPVDASRSCGCNPHIFIVSRGLLPELCILLLYTKSTINLDVDAMATHNAPRPCGGSNAEYDRHRGCEVTARFEGDDAYPPAMIPIWTW